jgi:hypothetical protein
MKNILYYLFIGLFFLSSCTSDDLGTNSENTTNSGSYATILTISNFLYLVNKTQIKTFDLSNPSRPLEVNNQEVGFDIESLYHYQGLLLIGSANNMYIYRIGNDGIPLRESTTQYNETFGEEVCTSDPIVVKGNLAYVTLASTLSTPCRGFTQINELRVYNIVDIKSPKLLETFIMSGPKGLGLGKNHLFVCDQTDGLVVFNLDEPTNPIKVKTFGGFEGFDLIVNGNILIVVAKDELLQFDITDETQIKYLSKIDL